MKIPHARHVVLLASLMIGAAGLSACSESPQQKYDSATSHLNDAKDALSEAKHKVDEQQKDVDKAQKKLNELQEKVESKRKNVAEATQAVDKTVNDEVLFRTLQKNLLDKDKFSDSAISVAVNHLVVTLSGVVPDQKTHDRAIKVAKNQPGVADVRDQLQIGQDQNNNPQNDQNAAANSDSPDNSSQSNAQTQGADAAPSDSSAQPSDNNAPPEGSPKSTPLDDGSQSSPDAGSNPAQSPNAT